MTTALERRREEREERRRELLIAAAAALALRRAQRKQRRLAAQAAAHKAHQRALARQLRRARLARRAAETEGGLSAAHLVNPRRKDIDRITGRKVKVKVTITMPTREQLVRIIESKTEFTMSDWQRLADQIQRHARTRNESGWPGRGQGVRGEATGYSLPKWQARVERSSPRSATISLSNPARAYRGRSRSGARYAKFREAGIPNRTTKGDLSKSVRRHWGKIVRRADLAR